MKTRKTTALSALIAASLLVVGCSGNTEPVDPGTPVDLTMTTYTANEEILATYQRLADEYRAIDPRLGELKIETIPQAEYIAQLTIRMNGGDSPDFGWMIGANLPAFADAGLLVDLTPLKTDENYNYPDIVPNLIKWTGDNGEWWGHPFANTIHPIVYNKDAFAAAGVDTPLELYESGNWTWDELRRIGKELVDAGVVTYGFDIPSFAFNNLNLFQLVQNAFGSEAWPADGTCGYVEEGSIQAFQLFHDMIFVDNSYPGKGENSNFATGDTGMFLGAPSALNTFSEAPFEFEVVPQPQPVDGRGSLLSQAWMVAFSEGKSPEVATGLLAYMMSEHGASQLQKFYVPPRASLLNGEAVSQLSPQLTAEAAERALVEPMASAVQPNFPVNYPELESTVRPILDRIWQAGADVRQIMTDACAAVAPLLGR